jgi:hypothetical protein
MRPVIVHGFLGLSDPLAGVVLGWALATGTAVGTAAVTEFRARRAGSARRRVAARLILEEVRVAERAAGGDDAWLLAGGRPLPTDSWNQRREHLVDMERWQTVADAFSAIDRLNARRDAQLRWRTEDTAQELCEARTEASQKLGPAARALAEIVG